MMNEGIAKNEASFQTIIDIELKTYSNPTVVDNGEFLLAKGIKRIKKDYKR